MPPRSKKSPPAEPPEKAAARTPAKPDPRRDDKYVKACVRCAVDEKNPRWAALRKKGAKDADILAVLHDVLGDSCYSGEPDGKDGSPGIRFESHGGKKPRVWLYGRYDGRKESPPTFEGAALVRVVREVLSIETPEQVEARKDSVLQSAESILADARRKAGVIRSLRAEEEDLKGQLKEIRDQLTTETDGLNAILLDVERGQSRLNFDVPAKPAPESEPATKEGPVPVTTTFVAVDGNRTLTARQSVPGKWCVRDEAQRPLAMDVPSLEKAQATALKELGIKRLDWKRVDQAAETPKAPTQSALAKEAAGKKAPKDGRVAVRCVLPMVAVLTVEPATDGWDAFIQDEGAREQVHIGNFADIENAKRELLHEADWSGATPEWKPVETAAGSGKAA